MKIRRGFVSNSSSSSFICVICGAAEGGYDVSLEDCGMVECFNEHIMCEDHVRPIDDIEIEGVKGFLISYLSKWEDQEEARAFMEKVSLAETMDQITKAIEEDEGEFCEQFILPQACPICRNEELSEEDMIKILVKDNGFTTEEDMKYELLSRFDSYASIKEYVKDIKKSN